jgi:hypothetical protein
VHICHDMALASRPTHLTKGKEALAMNARAAREFPIGARVLVHDFGVHSGRVVEHDPIVALSLGWGLRTETRVREGWIAVRLDAGKTWNGTPEHLRLIAADAAA